VHLLINEGNEEIARIMKRINISDAYYFNKKYKRVGHLVQDRFKNEAIESEQYLLPAARYIHNNPVKANTKGEVSRRTVPCLTFHLRSGRNV
jgi:putative transposase